MTNTETKQYLCDFIYNFADVNFTEFACDFKKEGLSREKEEFLKQIKNDCYWCQWILRELCEWGLSTQFKKYRGLESRPFFVENKIENGNLISVYTLGNKTIAFFVDHYGEDTVKEIEYKESVDNIIKGIFQKIYDAGEYGGFYDEEYFLKQIKEILNK